MERTHHKRLMALALMHPIGTFAHRVVDPWPVHKTGPPRNGAFDGVDGASQGIKVP